MAVRVELMTAVLPLVKVPILPLLFSIPLNAAIKPVLLRVPIVPELLIPVREEPTRPVLVSNVIDPVL